MFFKKRWVKCRQSGKVVAVRINEVLARQLGFDDEGNWYMSRWFPEFKGKTPRERQLEERDAGKEKFWICYPAGLHSIGRGVTLALASGEEFRVPQLEEIQAVGEEFQLKLTGVKVISSLSRLKRVLAEAVKQLRGAQRVELKEAREQLTLILPMRDQLGRFNVGVLQTRMTAVITRLIERIEGIYGWLPHFAARQQALEQLKKKAVVLIAKLSENLKAGVVAWPLELIFLTQIKPFKVWTKLTIGDLAKLRQLLGEGKLAAAQKLGQQVQNAIKVIGVLLRIDNLLEEIDFDILQGRARPAFLKKRLTVIGNRLKRVDETGFKKPVRGLALKQLRQAYRSLEKLEEAKKWLKAASAVLAG